MSRVQLSFGNGSYLLLDMMAADRRRALTIAKERGWCMGPYDRDPDNMPWYEEAGEDEVASLTIKWLEMGGV